MTLPDFLRNEDTAELILKAVKEMEVDDPAIFIQWNNDGFNNTPVANCRNGVPGQTLTELIRYIVASGGVNFRGLNTLFLFREGLVLSQCQSGIPLWYKIFYFYSKNCIVQDS